MSLNRVKAIGITLATLIAAGCCDLSDDPNCDSGTVPPAAGTPPVVPSPQTPIYSGGIYDGVIDNISGSGSNCATDGNFGGLIDENGNAYLADSNNCTFFGTNIGAASVQLLPDPNPQNFFPEITGNFNIYRVVGQPAEHSGAIVGGVSGPTSYCVSANIAGLNGNTPGTGAAAAVDPISQIWAQAIVSNNAPIDITSDGICGELVTTDNGANQLVGFYSEQAPGIGGQTLYNKDSSVTLLDSRWIDFGNALTITIDANGVVVSSVGFCQISGTFTTDNPDINAYTTDLDFGPTCPRTFSGKGWLSADNAMLTLIGTFEIDDMGNPVELGAPVYTLQRVVP